MNDQAAAPHADPERAFDGHYQLGSELGAGALGVVYRGVDEKLDKPVAIKVWHARFDDATPQRETYDAEARALTALEHPNLVAITDYGIAGKAPYLVMELLDGERLDARMRARTLKSAQAQGFMQSVLRALGYMHMRGVVHRNLKPDNVFLHKTDAGETLKLLDLGLESLAVNDNAIAGGATAVPPTSVYDPPEREQGIDLDGRADVYAAGLLMLHMLAGQEPERDLLRAAGAPDAEALSGLLPSAQPEVKAFIAKAIANDRSARFGNADQMLRALLELPTPWLIGQEEEEAAPVLSARPKSQAAHADFGSSDTLAMPAANGGGEPAAVESPFDEEFALRPIGLVARLRAHKMLLLIAGGVAALAIMGAGLAAYLGARAEAAKAAQLAAESASEAKKVAAKRKQAAVAEAPAPVLEHPYHAEEAEEVEEVEEGEAVAKGAAGKAAPPPTAAVAPQPGAHATEPAHAAAEHAEPASAAATSGGTDKAKPAEGAHAASNADEHAPTAAAAANGEVPAPAPVAATTKPAAASAHGAATPEHVSEHAPAAVDKPEALAKSAESAVPPPPAADARPAESLEKPPPAKKAPTPQELGSERHIEPDQAEIRHMLALAIKTSPRVAAADPWNIAIPDSLQALRDAIARGERGTPGNIKTLRRFNAANPEDVYGHLLLAGFYANRGYSLDALDQYDMAYRIDSSSRGAPEMLKHALNMVAQGISQTDAERFIERVYGREAQAQLTQQLRTRGISPAAGNRLRQLQSRLALKRR